MTQTDTVPVEGQTLSQAVRKVSVNFEHKVAVPNSYGHTIARAWVEDVVPFTASDVEVAGRITELFNSVSAAVFVQLGVEFDFDTVNGVVVPKAPEPVVQVTQGGSGGAAPSGGSSNGGGSIRVANAVELANNNINNGPLPDWLISEARAAGVESVYDNRHVATGNQPLFKEAVPRGGQGHGKDGKQKGFWPPK